jgi:hypothetical protein
LNVNAWLSLALDNFVLDICNSIVLSESTKQGNLDDKNVTTDSDYRVVLF